MTDTLTPTEAAEWLDDASVRSIVRTYGSARSEDALRVLVDHARATATDREPMQPYRVGDPHGRGIYRQHGGERSDADRWIGLVDEARDAARIVDALNRQGVASDDVVRSSTQRVADLQREQARQVRALEQGRDRATRERDDARAELDQLRGYLEQAVADRDQARARVRLEEQTR